jgi:hypothetical protein
MAHQRADAQAALALRDPGERGNAIDVDEETRLGEPHIERRHETLAAGEKARLLAEGVERVERILEGFRPPIGEPRRLQLLPPSPCLIFFLLHNVPAEA